MTEKEIGSVVLSAAIQIHRELGPGLLESVYEAILGKVLRQEGLQVERQVKIPIFYQGCLFDEGFRADMLVEKKVLLELKSVEKVMPVHKKQVLTYLKLSRLRLGYLLNFGEVMLKNGIIRVVNNLPEAD